MATITEDYVSFETAKLLKEKRFKTPVETGYYGDGRICHNLALDFMDYNHEDGYYSRPTIQMAMKWLRVEKGLYINTITLSPLEFNFSVLIVTQEGYYLDNACEGGECYLNYQDSCEAAIEYCLENLI